MVAPTPVAAVAITISFSFPNEEALKNRLLFDEINSG
jgi:hypothetical protein